MKTSTIYFLIYEGFELLDLSGPAGVFTSANDSSGKSLYQVKTVSLDGGSIRTSCGLTIDSIRCEKISSHRKNTLLASGAFNRPLKRAIENLKHADFIASTYDKFGRIGSICSGTFLLGAAGILTKKRVTTHWQASRALEKYFPEAIVEQNSLYINDGNLWTSAGVTTGIDMALAMVKEDHGKDLMGKVARQLVVHAHRPGNQSQFSSLLDSQLKSDHRFSELILWIDQNLHRSISVSQMADRVNLSNRSFHRKFTQQLAMTPFKYVETMRLQRARDYLEDGLMVKQLIRKVGFKSESGFRSAYEKHFGVPPSWHKNRTKMEQFV